MPVTDKQLRTIGYIEENLGLAFKGTTSIEAREFISSHINESYKARNIASQKAMIVDRKEAISSLFPNNNTYHFDEEDDWARPY